MEKCISFKDHIRNNDHNFDALVKGFPKTIIAAEFINDLFDQLFGDRLIHDNEVLWQNSTVKMLFGIHYCWINYFIQTAMGYNDLGLMSGRKAIEYTCYISKIKKRDKLAKLWIEKVIDKSRQNNFSSKFAVPQCFFKGKYSHLIPLLVIYNFSSDFGVHGNHASLVSKIIESKFRNKTKMSFQDDPKGIPHSCGVAIQTGSFILNALLVDLKEQIRDYDEFIKKVELKKQIVSEALIEILHFTDGKYPDNGVLESINNEDRSEINRLYEELKSNYTQPNMPFYTDSVFQRGIGIIKKFVQKIKLLFKASSSKKHFNK